MVHLAANAKEYSQNLEVVFIITLEMCFTKAVCLTQPHLDAVWLLSELQTVNLYFMTSCFFQLGGPHSVIVAEWLLSSSVLCRMGFAILLGKLFLWQRQHFAEVRLVCCRCCYLVRIN